MRKRGESHEVREGSIEYPVLLLNICRVTPGEAAAHLVFQQVAGLAIAA